MALVVGSLGLSAGHGCEPSSVTTTRSQMTRFPSSKSSASSPTVRFTARDGDTPRPDGSTNGSLASGVSEKSRAPSVAFVALMRYERDCHESASTAANTVMSVPAGEFSVTFTASVAAPFGHDTGALLRVTDTDTKKRGDISAPAPRISEDSAACTASTKSLGARAESRTPGRTTIV